MGLSVICGVVWGEVCNDVALVVWCSMVWCSVG